jgi:hypothetical protein
MSLKVQKGKIALVGFFVSLDGIMWGYLEHLHSILLIAVLRAHTRVVP